MINRISISSIDLNNLLAEGLYLVANATNSPVATGILVDVIYAYDQGGQVIQTVWGEGYTYKRKVFLDSNQAAPPAVYTNATAWVKVYFQGDAINTDITFDQNGVRSIGNANNTTNNIYSKNAVTVTSDRNAKNSIQDIDDTVLQAWSEVKPKKYKLNGDDKWSFGYIAQDIVGAFTRHGLDYKQYNIVHEQDGKFMLKYDMCHLLDRALMRP